MKKIKDSVASLILFVSIGTMLIIVLYSYNQTSKAINKLNKSVSSLEYSLSKNNIPINNNLYLSNKKNEIVEIDSVYNKYINKDLGFQIMYPRQADLGPLEIKESGDVVYLYNDDLVEEEILDKINKGDFEKVKGIPFAFIVKEVNDLPELEQFIKNRYGNKCSLGELNLNSEKDFYNVKVSSSDMIDISDSEACVMNFYYNIVYSPKKNKVAAWDIGQAVNFYNAEKDLAYDNIINESFKFID